MIPIIKPSKEICFTGFPQTKKQSLISLARSNNFIVRSKVTKHLDILVCGPNAGKMKIARAKAISCTLIEELEFYALL